MASKNSPVNSLLVSEETAGILREADAAILKLPGESHHLLYRLLHNTAAKIALVDSFYVGFYFEENQMIFPYSYDGRTYWDPNKAECRPLGLLVRQLRKPYTYRSDNGDLMNKGLNYGKRQNSSKDCVLVPVFEKPSIGTKTIPNNSVIGVMCIQSYQENTYADSDLAAMQWLANDLSLVLQREREDASRRVKLGSGVKGGTPALFDPDSIVNQMLEKMASIQRLGDALGKRLREEGRVDDDPILVAAEALRHECERRQTETIELFLASTLNQSNPLSQLSGRQRDIALLLVEGFSRSKKGYTVSELAGRLVLSANTIKTHLSEIYAKLGVSGRVEANALLKHYVANASV